MLSLAIELLIIDTIITFYLMKTFLDMISNMADSYFKAKVMEFVMHPATAFGINLVISNILGYFTGAGLVAGLANLGSSVLVGFILPVVMGNWYNPDEVRERADAKKADKKRGKLKRVV